MNISRTFWDEFKQKSNNLEVPFFSNFSENTNELYSLIVDIFNELYNFENKDINVRVFDERGGIRIDLKEVLLNTKASYDKDNLENSFQETLKIDKFCIALKEINALNPSLENLLYKNIVKDFVKDFGIPLGGFEFYLFIGNYGYTPFGIHEDLEHSLLFNLGPNKKDLWLWERDNYYNLTNTYNSLIDFDKKLFSKYNQYYELGTGDFCHIPQNYYHILKTEEFSVMIGLIPYPGKFNSSNSSFVFNKISQKQMVRSDIQNIIETVNSNSHFQVYDDKFGEFHHALLESNGFFEAKSKHDTKVESAKILSGEYILNDYQICCVDKSSNVIIVIHRKITFKLPNSIGLIKLITFINQNSKFKLQLIHDYLNDYFELDMINYIIDIFVDNKIIILDENI